MGFTRAAGTVRRRLLGGATGIPMVLTERLGSLNGQG
jgi:hypothetical protein